MSDTSAFRGRPLPTPPPGVVVPEYLIVKFRGHARRLLWSALLLVVVCGSTAYFYDRMPAPFEGWGLLILAGVIVVAGVILPWLVWLSRTYTITTRRVIVRTGLGVRRKRELSHTRGYAITVQRGLFQRLWRAGTLVLSNGVDMPVRMVNIPSVHLVHETLADQIEVSQILAHRQAQEQVAG